MGIEIKTYEEFTAVIKTRDILGTEVAQLTAELNSTREAFNAFNNAIDDFIIPRDNTLRDAKALFDEAQAASYECSTQLQGGNTPCRKCIEHLQSAANNLLALSWV
jgi:uncharacterized coiled-coil DUF342 family protein